jgi:CRP-like cAMP-binding protein
MPAAKSHSPNRLLASLPRAEYERLAPALKPVVLKHGFVITEPNDEVEQVYFPYTGMISLLAVMTDGAGIETATVGNEGAVGILAGLGPYSVEGRAVVQLPGTGAQIKATAFRKIVADSPQLRDLILRYTQVLIAQVETTAACNALHPVEARLCRWILQARDRAEGDKIALTQELLSQMLGVRRTTVSVVASKLQDAGMIRYRRGFIEVLDMDQLKQNSCECYDNIRKKAARLMRDR